MTGRIAIVVLLLECDGSVDRAEFSWTDEQVSTVRAQIAEAMTWWNTTGSCRDVEMVPAATHFAEVVRQPYEPLNGEHSSWDDRLWMNASLQRLGYGSLDDAIAAAKDATGAAQAAVIFLANDGGERLAFTNGYFGYSNWGGSPVMMTYTNNGWGARNLGVVTAHELGHVFHATDEYSQPNYATCSCSGFGSEYNGCANDNCNPPDGACSPNRDVCLMSEAQMPAWNRHHVCAATKCHLGWAAVPEACNGVDDDCDGVTDPPFSNATMVSPSSVALFRCSSIRRSRIELPSGPKQSTICSKTVPCWGSAINRS
jgi:hypothetical protein